MAEAGALPSFDAPPLNEVVLGVQFVTPPGYQQIYAADVWGLFRAGYPNVSQQQPIVPAFEAFGAVPVAPPLQFTFGQPALHPRYWLASESGHDLIQFQSDRFLHNWRQLDGVGTYPRFEPTIEKFEGEVRQLGDYMGRFSAAGGLVINQAEVSYLNLIVEGDGRTLPQPERYLRFLRAGSRKPETFMGNFREILRLLDKVPARLYVETASAMDALGRQAISFNLTVRGAPPAATIDSAIEFIHAGREVIVRTFADLTTEEAHQTWRRSR